MLEPCEDLLDQVEIGAAGREEQQAVACASDFLAPRFGSVAAGSVRDNDVVAAERRNQLRFGMDLEGGAVDRVVENPGSVGPIMAQGCDEGRRVPVPGRLADSLSPLGARPRSRAVSVLMQVSLMRISLRRSAVPRWRFASGPSRSSAVGVFFLKVQPGDRRARQTASRLARVPRPASKACNRRAVICGQARTFAGTQSDSRPEPNLSACIAESIPQRSKRTH